MAAPYYDLYFPSSTSSGEVCSGKFIQIYGSCERFNPRLEYSFAFMENTPDRVNTHWQQSRKATSAVSFLDLPKELRDMIYSHTFDPPTHHSNNKEDISATHPSYRPSSATPSFLALLRTCRQLHSEYSEFLYSFPINLQISILGSYYTYRLPLSARYAHLVKKINLMIPCTWDSQPAIRWNDVLEISNGLVSAFPDVKTVRVGWSLPATQWSDRWRVFSGLEAKPRESQIKEVEDFIRKATRNGMRIPHQLELLQLRKREIVDTPFSEAVRNLRPRPPGED